MKSTHCSTSRGANRGPNFFSNWTVSSRRWPNIPGNRWSKHYFICRMKSSCSHEDLFFKEIMRPSVYPVSVKQVVSNPAWPEPWIPADCYLVTGCSSCSSLPAHGNHSTSPSRNCTDSHTSQTHISPGPSIPFQFNPALTNGYTAPTSHSDWWRHKDRQQSMEVSVLWPRRAVNDRVCALATDLFWTENWETDTPYHWTREGGKTCRHEVTSYIILVWRSSAEFAALPQLWISTWTGCD